MPKRSPKPKTPLIVFRAGCGRESSAAGHLRDFAYTGLEFTECPTCEHRVTPDTGPAFCTWRPVNSPHPFASLQGIDLAPNELEAD